ncbi:hypothetical protein EJB05_13389, partial [Eragrostis curvula]
MEKDRLSGWVSECLLITSFRDWFVDENCKSEESKILQSIALGGFDPLPDSVLLFPAAELSAFEHFVNLIGGCL